MPRRREGTVAAARALITPSSPPVAPTAPAAAPPQPKQSSIDAAKQRLIATPDQPPPSSEYVRAAQQQSRIDAAKLRTPPPAASPARSRLDADALISSLKLRLRLPEDSEGPTRSSSIDCIRNLFGSRAAAPASAGQAGAAGADAPRGAKDAEGRQARPVRISSVDWAKRNLPGHEWVLEAEAPLQATPPARKQRSTRGEGVDAWAAPEGGWTAGAVCCALVNSLFLFASTPPCAAIKLIALFPALLLLTWAHAVRPMPLGPLAPFAAVGLAVPVLVAQCFVASFPLAAGLAGLASELKPIVDAAFGKMTDGIRRTTAGVLAPMHLPPSLEAKVAIVLSRPLTAAIDVVRGLLPDFGKAVPARFKDPRPLAPLLFVLLLVLLLVVQVLPLLLLGLAGNGDLAVLLGTLVCVQLALVALKAARIVQLVLSLIEGTINFVVQFLLRRVLNVRRLQGLLDAAADPRTVVGLARRADGPSDEPGNIVATVAWADDATTA